MQQDKSFLSFLTRKGGLAIIVITSLIALLINLGSTHSKETDPLITEIEPVNVVEQQAWQLAQGVVEADEDVQEQFVAELLELYLKVEDSDVVIFYCEGGWGSRPLSINPEGASLVLGIESKLTQLGYAYFTADYPRTSMDLREYLFEAKEFLMRYPEKAKQMAAKIDFLTQQVDGLKAIVVGKSTGAIVTDEIARLLENNPSVYTIQIGSPLGKQKSLTDRSLTLSGNGLVADAFVGRDIKAMIKANGLKSFILNCAPSFTPIDWLISRTILVIGICNTDLAFEVPGHKYMWHYPGVSSTIESFLVEHFDRI